VPFPVPIQPATGDETQVKRCRSQTAHALRSPHEGRESGQIVVLLNPQVGKPGAQQREPKFDHTRGVDRPAVEKGTLPTSPVEGPAHGRGGHHAHDWHTFGQQAGRCREDGQAVGEVRGAIERVYMPGAARSASLLNAFLAHNGIIRERGARGSNNHCLGPAVELGHQLNLQPSAAATVHYSRYVTTGEMAPPKAQ
jgi:hypothetical protein